MKNIGIAALAAIAALVLGFGARLGTQTAHAEVTGSVAIGCEFLIGAIDGNTQDASTAGDATAACNGITAAEVDALAGDLDGDGTPGEAGEEGLGDNDGVLEESDFTDIDLDGNQITDGGGSIYIIAFVDDDERVTFDAPSGLSVTINDDGGTDEAAPADDANAETCEGDDDEDCGTTTTTNGDGVVVATITDGTAADDASLDVDVSQADDATSVSSQTINVQGAADEVDLVAVEEVIGTSADVGDCTEEADASDGDQLGDTEKTFVVAVVTDSDGDPLTRVAVVFTDDDDAVAIDESESAETGADPSFDTGLSVDAGENGIAAFAVVCGDEDTGEGVITATILGGTAGEESDDVTITVVGEPANVALTASPAAIDCDGTASSTVSATVTDADGNNVVDGTNVNFSVVALGIASPINADTADGVASSTITPLSAGVAGVTVLVTSGDAQASIRVDCNPAAAPTTAPGASPTPGTGVQPPDTGNGGYLGQDSSAGFPMWTLVALTLGAVVLAAGGMVTKKVTR